MAKQEPAKSPAVTAPVPVPKAAPKPKRYVVALAPGGSIEVDAFSEAEAIEKYNADQGIIATENKHSVGIIEPSKE